MNFPLSRYHIFISLQIALTAWVSYIVGLYTSRTLDDGAAIGGLWAVISSIVVLQATREGTASTASLRMLGTAIGSLVSGIFLSFFPFSAWGMALCIFMVVLLCHAVQIPDHARLAAITVAVVMVSSSLSPNLDPAFNAAMRFGESCIGIATAMFSILLWRGEQRSADQGSKRI